MDIDKIANLITEDPNIFNDLIDRWDQQSELDHDAYFLVLRILNRVLARYELKLDQKMIKATPTPSGFTVKGLRFLDATKPEEDEEELALMPPAGPEMGGMPGGMPGGPEMGQPPGAPPAMPPMESVLREFNEKHKQKLIDRLVKADGEPSAAASFDANRDVNIYRAISGEFAKEARKNGLEISHHYLAPPPGTKDEPHPVFSVAKLKQTPPEMMSPEPGKAQEGPLDIDLGLEPEPAQEAQGRASDDQLEALDQALPPELAPDVSFPKPEEAPMESLEKKLKEILG